MKILIQILTTLLLLTGLAWAKSADTLKKDKEKEKDKGPSNTATGFWDQSQGKAKGVCECDISARPMIQNTEHTALKQDKKGTGSQSAPADGADATPGG